MHPDQPYIQLLIYLASLNGQANNEEDAGRVGKMAAGLKKGKEEVKDIVTEPKLKWKS